MTTDLKTTPEERAALRAEAVGRRLVATYERYGACLADPPELQPRGSIVTIVLDDLDTLAAEVGRLRRVLQRVVDAGRKEGVPFHAPNMTRAVLEATYVLAPEPKHDLRFCECHCRHGVEHGGPACATCENST